jgi:hypothetical protein
VIDLAGAGPIELLCPRQWSVLIGERLRRIARRLSAVLGHVVSFGTWRSFCMDNELSDRDAVDAMTALVATTAPDRQETGASALAG